MLIPPFCALASLQAQTPLGLLLKRGFHTSVLTKSILHNRPVSVEPGAPQLGAEALGKLNRRCPNQLDATGAATARPWPIASG